MKQRIFCFAIILFLSFNALAFVNYSNSTFLIQFPSLRPLQIGSETSPVFFETKSKIFMLQGKPDSTLISDDVCSFEWAFDDSKHIKIIFTKNSASCRIDVQSVGLEEITKWGFAVHAIKNEYFTGIMERVVDGPQTLSWQKGITDAMDLRGQIMTTVVKPTVSLYCPFYISSCNYSLFVEGTWPGTFDFCHSNPDQVQITFEGPFTAVIINASKDPAELVKNHSLRVGPKFFLQNGLSGLTVGVTNIQTEKLFTTARL
jgi:hypothetical protein